MTSMADVPAYMLPGVPVLQPPHLEGLSDPALSTEILPGPPSLVSIRRTVQKRDPKNSSVFVSYLPPSDPGSTYSGLMAGPLAVEIGGSRRKRARVDKGTANGRAQRANARSLNNSILPISDPVVPEVPSRQPSVPLPDSDSLPAQPDSDDPSMSLSRANSQPGGEEGTLSTTNGRGRAARKDKGKGKETDRGFIKEEPVPISLSPEPSLALPNDDHCSSCRSLGALVYCDSCPRAFHLWCLDPPMEAIDLPEGDKWFCPSCIIRKHPPSKPTRSSFMSPLIHQLQVTIPKEFQLPDDIRNFFKDVSTATNGAYVDTSEVKQLRLNRHGQLEDRDPYRLKDRNGIPVICFRCSQSSLPRGVIASTSSIKCSRRSTSTLHSSTPETWRSMLSCDYCNLHWHLDCLDPPLTTMPPYGKKWMCPNHADHVLQPKRRIPKQSATPIDITKPNQRNNGNIEVIHSQPAPLTEKLALDEVLINGRRYRVPERIIMLDFWSKISDDPHKSRDEDPPSSRVSSPLTSLSSLDEESRLTSEDLISRDELHAAQLLFDLHHSLLRRTTIPVEKPTNIQPAEGRLQERVLVDSTAQTDPEQEPCGAPSFPRTVEQSDRAKPTTHKRKASSRVTGRSATETAFHEVSLHAQAPSELPSPAKSKRPRVATKQEQDEELGLADGLVANRQERTIPARRQGRGRRKPRQAEKRNIPMSVASPSSIPIATESPLTNYPTTPTPVAPETNLAPPVASTPSEGPATKVPPTSKASMTITQSNTSSTPTLKIRLPRLSAVSAAAHANLTAPASQSPSSSISPAPEADARPRRRSLRRQDSASISVSGTSSFTPDDADEPELTKPKRFRRMPVLRGGGRRGR
ncbi:hypothetical protein F5141DRAFT_818960 [Pisolithus sp. B1]|nr:hypothetical protein F5141DRAFT_818960 [Pisolithus sp. B1]KAI6126222.1 hypothetical protein EV401DRAFT_1935113 [Pisolithus croceorrhizus]